MNLLLTLCHQILTSAEYKNILLSAKQIALLKIMLAVLLPITYFAISLLLIFAAMRL